MSLEQAAQLGVWIPLFLGSSAVLWYCLRWRDRIQQHWGDRIRRIHAGLNARTQEELFGLHAAIEDDLGAGRPFDPLTMVVNTDPLVERASMCSRLMRARDSLSAHYNWYRKLSHPTQFAATSFVLGSGTLVIKTLIDRQGGWLVSMGYAGMILALLLAGIVLLAIRWLENRLAEAHHLAYPELKDE